MTVRWLAKDLGKKKKQKKPPELSRALTIFQTFYMTQAVQKQCREIRTLTFDLPPLLGPRVRGSFSRGKIRDSAFFPSWINTIFWPWHSVSFSKWSLPSVELTLNGFKKPSGNVLSERVTSSKEMSKNAAILTIFQVWKANHALGWHGPDAKNRETEKLCSSPWQFIWLFTCSFIHSCKY